jgi:CRP-like cAMP-binding protein
MSNPSQHVHLSALEEEASGSRARKPAKLETGRRGERAIENEFIRSALRGRADCKNCAVRHMVLFAQLQPDDFDLIHRPIDDLTVPTGEVLYRQSEPGTHAYTVRSGLVKLVQYAPDGGQRIVRLLRAGDVAGIEAVVGEPYQHTAIVLHQAEVCRIPQEVLDRLNTETPRLHRELMARWQKALNEADAFLTELSTGTARSRVARLLLRLADPDDGICVLPGREDMGAMLGITTETASRTIAQFKREGIIAPVSAHTARCKRDQLAEISGA